MPAITLMTAFLRSCQKTSLWMQLLQMTLHAYQQRMSSDYRNTRSKLVTLFTTAVATTKSVREKLKKRMTHYVTHDTLGHNVSHSLYQQNTCMPTYAILLSENTLCAIPKPQQ